MITCVCTCSRILVSNACSIKSPSIRSIWCKPRTRGFWEAARSGVFGSQWWRENLRMNEDTFNVFCSELKPYIRKETTRFRESVSVEERVAVTLWRLATNAEYRTIASLFGLGISTVGNIVLETCQAIAKFLLPRYVKFPSPEMFKEIITGFEVLWGLPQTVGAVDGSHIPILKPVECASDYYNRKGYYSIILQAVVDFRGRFLDVNIGWPGKVHDARVFANSSFYQKASTGELFPSWRKKVCGVDVPLLILGDPAYPLLPWLMKPYSDTGNLTEKQKNFNYRQSRGRMVVENAFGRLKGRWRCLLKRMDYYNIDNIINVVASCIVAHNICEIYGDSCDNDWVNHDETSPQDSSTSDTTKTGGANSIRNALAEYLSHS